VPVAQYGGHPQGSFGGEKMAIEQINKAADVNGTSFEGA